MFVSYVDRTTKAQMFQEPNIKAVRQYSQAAFFKYKKGGDLDLNIRILNQSSKALVRNLVGRLKSKLP